jgi:hypothetical protein
MQQDAKIQKSMLEWVPQGVLCKCIYIYMYVVETKWIMQFYETHVNRQSSAPT